METSRRTTSVAPETVVKPPETPLRRRRCDNCNKLFQPVQKTQRFDNRKCKDEFHQHGSAFGPLKTRLEKLVTKLTREECSKLRRMADDLLRGLKNLEERILTLEHTENSPKG